MDALKFIVCGEKRTSEGFIEVTDPYTGELFETVCAGEEKDVEDAVSGSLGSFAETAAMPAHERKRVLDRLASFIEERKDEFTAILIREGGKVRSLAEAEVDRAAETIRISAEESVRLTGEIIPLDRTAAGEGRTCFIRRVPVGTVLAITPFNYPLNLACHKIGPAIAAGNPFILKPASKTPVSALLLGELIIEAGYVPGAVSVVPCTTALAEKMVRDERIACLSFTGSSSVGWALKSIAGRKNVSLELGGNAAAIVHSDADTDYAASRIATGAYANAGQVCISVQRVFVQENIYSEFFGKLSSIFSSVRCGDPSDPQTILGPMLSPGAAAEAWRKVTDAVSAGAVMTGEQYRGGSVFPPVILEGTTPEMEVNSTEVFAPVVTVTPYKNLEEAISMANDSLYGLQTGIFTESLEDAFYAYDNCEAGGVIINDIPTFRSDVMPYGGVKMSGFGREGPAFAIEEMTEMKIMVVSRKGV